MNTSDYISLAIAIIAGVAAILTLVNIFITGQQMRIQKAQWEFSHIPVFKIIHSETFNSYKNYFIIENSNQVYHQINSVTFTDPEVTVESLSNGGVEITSRTGTEVTGRKNYEGFQVTLEPKIAGKITGYFILIGIDALGNKFAMRSKDVTFEKSVLQDELNLKNSYLIKV